MRLVEVAATNDWRHDAEATAAAVLAELDPSAPDPVFGSQPGRYEQENLSEIRPSRWIFDGAHNPMKLTALVGPLRSEPGPRLGIVSVGRGRTSAAVLLRLPQRWMLRSWCHSARRPVRSGREVIQPR